VATLLSFIFLDRHHTMNTLIVACPSCKTKNKMAANKQHRGPRCGKCQTPLPMAGYAVPVELTDQDAAQVIREADLPLLLDLYSPNCGPCRTLAPVIDKLARQFFGRAIIAKLDTSTNHHTAGRYGVRGVPTLIFFKNGQVVDQVVGALPEDALVAKLNSFIRT
jgi:thioredoxin 2